MASEVSEAICCRVPCCPRVRGSERVWPPSNRHRYPWFVAIGIHDNTDSSYMP
jgi:hypothetical protein